MKIETRYQLLLKENAAAHRHAADRLGELRDSGVTRNEVLGDSECREFLAAADHQVNAVRIDADDMRERVRRLLENAQVIFASKRQAIVRVGELICYCNRFGVCTYLLPLDIPISGWGSVNFVPNFFGCSLPRAIGAVVDNPGAPERIFNFSACRP